MRGDGSWNVGTYEAPKMSSVYGLPARGSDASILITRVHLHPLCERVEFWAKFSQQGAEDYLNLAKDIQLPGTRFREFEGNPGDQCLAQKDGTWYRARIVSQKGSQCAVFLIDKGMTYSTNSSMLAWGKNEYFSLPPEVEFCVLANVLPVSHDNRWSPVALEFLKSLTGRSVKVHVQNFLILHRMFVLQVPCISKQMYEMGFARKLPPEMFEDFLLASLQCKGGPMLPPQPQSVMSMSADKPLHKEEMFLYPELQAGTVETVVVTEVTNPQRIFCQLKVFSQEFKKLSEQLTQCCDGRKATYTIGPEMIGFPCVARGFDGKWYRSVLQQVFPANKVVEVLNVDYGTKQIVEVGNVRPLASQFFRMPVVTYNCALHGIIDKGVGWTTSQIEYLRSLLLFKTVIAKFEYQSITEGVYYVTLYGDENSNINNVFGSKERCLLQCEKNVEDYVIRTSAHSHHNTSMPLSRKGEIDDNKRELLSQLLPFENLPINSTHVAFVQYVSSPSEFWIQTQSCAKEFDKLMHKMANLYQNDSKTEAVKMPILGLYCAAQAEDGEYYRAMVTEVGTAKAKVFFVDYGNSEEVNHCCIKALGEEFKKVPQLAIQCTLADVRPKGREWSHEASKLFTQTVMDKALNAHVTSKLDGCHFVQLTDPDAQGEKDLAKLLCVVGFAEKDEKKRPSKVKTSSHFALPSTEQNIGTSFLPQNAFSSDFSERKGGAFKEQMFSIGTILDVNVSFIESPNDFWCQSVQSTGHLKLLMCDMQTYYRDSEFQPLVESACVARHPENGMWYRVFIVHKHETPHVDVLFVDYGQTETVSVFDLRRIGKDFTSLPGQAFRCSLFNPVNCTSAISDWTEEAVDRFNAFVDTATKSFVILKCTIYAVMYSEQKIVFNIVDLETPFESICTSLVNLGKNAPRKVLSGPSFRLDTYYYSTHNVKTGTEEQVTVTSVKDVSHFFCQLQKNADILEDLQLKVATLCEQLQRVKVPPFFGTVCFAKYTDGHWYRGQIKATKPTIMVHFVDYGDTLIVDKSDLLPIPKEASDIMAVPVQALLCSLSDIPDDIPREANSWFETNSTECEFKALIIARKPDGKLLVELYQGDIQVNPKLKKKFDLEMHTNEPVVYHNSAPAEVAVKPAQKMATFHPNQAFGEIDETKHSTRDSISFVSKTPHPKNPPESVEKKMFPPIKPRHNVKGNYQLYTPPHKRELNVKTSKKTPKCTVLSSRSEQKDRDHSVQMKSNKASSSATQNWTNDDDVPPRKIEKVPKLLDLPPQSITKGMVTEVCISHCNSPLSFYVQLVKEVADIYSIVDKLNDRKTASEYAGVTDVHPGDLVQAEFADDSSRYRAVVKAKQEGKTALVEFVDFGNTAVVPFSKMSKLDKSFLQYPAYSTHCMLKGAAGLEKDTILEPGVSSAFESAIGNVGEKQLKCKFLQLSGTVWEVTLEDEVECKMSVRSQPEDNKHSKFKKAPSILKMADSCCLRFKKHTFQEGQKLSIYIAAITDAQTFWCQFADSDELDQLSGSLIGAGDSVDYVNVDSLSVGSPCIALYSEDQLWYRAEVLKKTEGEASVLFVDYGNKSHVKLSDVRQIPPEMVQNPVQAFFCELEGFDSSEGFWENGAVDELSALTADQLLQLTVCKVTMEDDKAKCYVRLECEGQVINESMRKLWKISASEVVVDKSETTNETQLLTTDSLGNEKAVESCVDSGADVASVDGSHMVEVMTKDPCQFNEDFRDPSQFVEKKEEEGLTSANDAQVTPENSFDIPLDAQMCSTSLHSQILEPFEVDISAITIEPKEASNRLFCIGHESEDLSSSYEAEVIEKDLEEQDFAVMDSLLSDDSVSPLDKCFLEIADESVFKEPFESPYKEASADSDIKQYLDVSQETENPELLFSEARSSSATMARWVPCLLLSPTGTISPAHETSDGHEEGSQTNEDLFLVSGCDFLPDSFDSDLSPEEGSKRSPSVTSARLVPRVDRSPTVQTCSHDISDGAAVDVQKDVNLFWLSSHDDFPLESLTAEIIPETTADNSSLHLNKDLLPWATNVTSQDSLDFEEDGETSEESASETPAFVTPMKMNEDLFISPLSEVTSQDSTDHCAETCKIMGHDLWLLASNLALPHDSFDSDLETETLHFADSETRSTTSSTPKVNFMNEDLLLEPVTDVTAFDQNSETSEETAAIVMVDVFSTLDVTTDDSHDFDEETRTSTVASPDPVTASEMSTMEEAVAVALSHDSFDEDMTTTEEHSLDEATFKRMNQELVLLPKDDVMAQNSNEQECNHKAAGHGPCSSSSDHAPEPSNTCEDLLGSGDVAAIEANTVTSAEQEEEVFLLDLSSDEALENLYFSDARSSKSVTEEEAMDQSFSTAEVPCAQLIELEDVETGAEPESASYSSTFPQMTELAENESVEDIFCEEEAAAEGVSSESVSVEDSSDDTLTEESCYHGSLGRLFIARKI